MLSCVQEIYEPATKSRRLSKKRRVRMHVCLLYGDFNKWITSGWLVLETVVAFVQQQLLLVDVLTSAFHLTSSRIAFAIEHKQTKKRDGFHVLNDSLPCAAGSFLRFAQIYFSLSAEECMLCTLHWSSHRVCALCAIRQKRWREWIKIRFNQCLLWKCKCKYKVLYVKYREITFYIRRRAAD